MMPSSLGECVRVCNVFDPVGQNNVTCLLSLALCVRAVVCCLMSREKKTCAKEMKIANFFSLQNGADVLPGTWSGVYYQCACVAHSSTLKIKNKNEKIKRCSDYTRMKVRVEEEHAQCCCCCFEFACSLPSASMPLRQSPPRANTQTQKQISMDK